MSVLGYYLAATWVIPGLLSSYDASYGGLWGWAIWAAQALLLAFPWLVGAQFRRRWWHSAVAFSLATLAASLPPLGAVGHASPLFAAILWPDGGLVALVVALVMLGLIAGVATAWRRRDRLFWPVAALAGTGLGTLWASAVMASTPSVIPEQWAGATTRVPALEQTRDLRVHLAKQARLRSTVTRRVAGSPEGTTLVLPESVAGLWHDLTVEAWQPINELAQRKDVRVLVGALAPTGHRERLRSVLYILGERPIEKARRIEARQPVPVVSWRPWDPGETVVARWWDPGSDRVGTTAVAAIFCYEDLLVWPAAQAFLQGKRPEVLVAANNHWWAPSDGGAAAVQKRGARALARIFGVPLVWAINLPVEG